MSVEIKLPVYNWKLPLSRDFIQTALPGSLLAEALEVDPTTPEITLPNPIITPETIQFLIDYSQGMEPQKHNPNLEGASHYLNIPWMLYYIDPMYDLIDKSEIDSLANHILLDRAIRENHSLIVGYFIAKGIPITNSMLELAIENNAIDVVRILLPRLPDVNKQYLLNLAVRTGSLSVIELLLQTPVDVTYELLQLALALDRPEILDSLLMKASKQEAILSEKVQTYTSYRGTLDDLFIQAIESQKLKILDYLLTRGYVHPDRDYFMEAIESNNIAIPLRILASPNFNPNYGLLGFLVAATVADKPDLVEAILQDPKTRLNRDILERTIIDIKQHQKDDAQLGNVVKDYAVILNRLQQLLQMY